jgi:uncharacterized phage protein gp47/JayE
MPVPAYSELIVPLTRAQILNSWIAVLQAAGFPTDSWGPTDEPRATIEGASEVMVDATEMIAAIGKMGVVGTTGSDGATGSALDFLGSDWFGETRNPAETARSSSTGITLTESAATPHTFAARELMLTSTADPSLVYYNEAGFTLSASSTANPIFVAESPGAAYNVSGSTLSLSTPIAGVTLTVLPSTTWLDTAGSDEEGDESFRARLRAKWGSLTNTGSVDGYKYHARVASTEVNRVFVQEDPMADATLGDPAVTVYVAGAAGPISAGALADVSTRIQTYRPLGVIVETQNVATTAYEVRGAITIRTGKRTAVEAAINSLLPAYFRGETISINGDELEGLQIGAYVYVSQIIEIVQSIPGVVSFVLKNGADVIRVPGTDDVILPGDNVATLTLNTALFTWAEVA